MNHPLTLQALANIHQADLLKEAEVKRLLRETPAARRLPARQQFIIGLLMTAGAGLLFFLAR